MRQKRAKSYRKQMLVYNHAFKFRAPYQVLVDHEIVEIAEHGKFDLVKYLRNTLQDEVKPMITQCAMQALYLTKNQAAIDLAKLFERRRCGHKGAAVPVDECIEGVVNVKGQNKHRYVVACQDVELRRRLRRVPGVPLVHMNRSVMVMEPLSTASSARQQTYENAKLNAGLNDVEAGLIRKEGEGGDAGDKEEGPQKKKRKGPKEPNPLSVKKKKTVTNGDTKENDEGKKKRRRKHRRNAGEDSAEKEPDEVISAEEEQDGSGNAEQQNDNAKEEQNTAEKESTESDS